MSSKPEWVEAREAARLISANSGRVISTDYIRTLGNHGYIVTKPHDTDGHRKLYLRSSCAGYVVSRTRGPKAAPKPPSVYNLSHRDPLVK